MVATVARYTPATAQRANDGLAPPGVEPPKFPLAQADRHCTLGTAYVHGELHAGTFV